MKSWLLFAFTFLAVPSGYAMQQQAIQFNQNSYDVIKVDHLEQLELFLKNPESNRYYQKFATLQKALPPCAQLNFAMNAGMYHADFQPVGLYIEQGKELRQLNQTQGFGNFFMQPNGVVAWNDRRAVIKTTADYAHSGFQAQFATQSGPMLVYQGRINDQFLPDSTSLKIRNGVGVKNNELYFVISQQRVSFYQFAQFFKQQLKIDHALYLDGSISSVYSTQSKRHDKRFNLGPMVAEVNREKCKS
ncbi:phosphodiester glycosidase family protein [Acinetobacter courvalinii]|uniref:phosphodiester glycosidase family protein n=1 Tax=Acinetobacter courvalinii TaxID=280147 RepID=UPI0028A18360|nr:phosphodiester glycosidase family protein [Acinetobacter courvalinii]